VSEDHRPLSDLLVVVTRDLPGTALGRLERSVPTRCWPEERPPSSAELAELAAPADALLTMITDRVDAALLDRCPQLRVVSNMAVGVDNLDLDELTRRSIPVGHTPGVLTDATADLAFALILATARRIVETRDAILAGKWTTWHPSAFLGLELAGSTLGVVGTGAIGQAVIARARGFNMNVVATSRTPRDLAGVTYLELPELLETADIVSLHVALTPDTRHLIGAAELARMKPGAILINTARGPIVDIDALYDAMKDGTVLAAGLDVLPQEPANPQARLIAAWQNNEDWIRHRLVLTPHSAFFTPESMRDNRGFASRTAARYLRDGRLENCVNKQFVVARS
jgi:lactate dehydrogenase-like 2-hydroxyacid dehydrogenase